MGLFKQILIQAGHVAHGKVKTFVNLNQESCNKSGSTGECTNSNINFYNLLALKSVDTFRGLTHAITVKIEWRNHRQKNRAPNPYFLVPLRCPSHHNNDFILALSLYTICNWVSIVL